MTLHIQNEILNRDLSINGFILMFKINNQHNFLEKIADFNLERENTKLVVGFSTNLTECLSTNSYGVKLFNSDKLFPEKYNATIDADFIIWVKADDPGALFKNAAEVKQYFSTAATVVNTVRMNTYLYHYNKEKATYVNRGLDGFEDGTVNPTDSSTDEDVTSACTIEQNGQICGSLWAVQKWQHNFEWLNQASSTEKESLIGRTMTDSEEIEDRLPSSHLSKTDQDSFSPNARVWRRSMPWFNDQLEGGLLFSCFTNDLDKFEKQLARMVGNSDGQLDGVFTFSSILFTNYFWAPPVDSSGKLVLNPA